MAQTVPFHLVITAETPPQVSLSRYTTLRLGGLARSFVQAKSTEEVLDAVRAADKAEEPLLLLGGGSNLVVGDEGFAGTVVRIASSGWQQHQADNIDTADEDATVLIDVAAGQDWDEFVAGMVASSISGVEWLSGVPGLVGAAPIQNIGAYGCEISDVLDSIELYERAAGVTRRVPAAELGLNYRTSRLKGTDTGVVLSVRFALTKSSISGPIRYPELARALGLEVGAQAPIDEVRAAVLKLRRGKGMLLDEGDHDTWSAGSFFTNPLIPQTQIEDVLARISSVVGAEAAVPQYPAPDAVKLSAAWLIERAGFSKGYAGPGGRATLSTKHTLALTNRGEATTEDLLVLAREVRDGVFSRFGVELHPEPLMVNCSL